MIKKGLLLINIFALITIIQGNQIVLADENNSNDSILINSFERDLNGDGFQEYIRLNGSLMSNESNFFQDVWVTIEDAFEDEWSISLQHGYHPELTFKDLTGNKNPDIFYKVAKDEDLNSYHYQFYHFVNNKIKAITLPEHEHIEATFSNDFMIEINLSPSEKFKIDVSAHKDMYINDQIYNSNGKNKGNEQAIIAQNVDISPILISNSKGYGLKTTQLIYGKDKDDIVGELTTIWHYKENKWVNIKTEVQSKI